MSLAAIAIKNRAVTYFAAGILFLAGVAAFFNLGQLEDPAFTIKTASIITLYPGADPEEVELEVTDLIEQAIQEMAEIDFIESYSRAGFSYVKIEILSQYWSDRLPQIWDELRRKIRDIEADLPPGAERPIINDDFGDVFGFQLAVTGEGYSDAELETYAKMLRKELSLVEGVARVDLWGVQQKVIYLDVTQTQLSQLGITEENIRQTLQVQNAVVDAGSLDLRERRLRIAPTGEFNDPEDIANLTLRPNIIDDLQASAPRSSEIIRIRDIGTVREGYAEPPFQLMRFNGAPAIGISIANITGINVVDMGRAVDARLQELVQILPVGVEVHKVHWQSDIVSEAVNGFLISFAQAVGIVLIVLTLFMGLRISIVIGFALIFTILSSFMLMAIFGIDLQRMSLGALVVALGMMVDNAIVVADGYLVRVQQGKSREEAAIEAANLPAWPLLGATIVAVMAFYPIYASTDSVGEYCQTLFTVIAISLLMSWVISMTLTPIQCMDLLKTTKGEPGADPYDTRFYRTYRRFLGGAVRVRWLTVGVMVVVLVGSVLGFGNVRQLFFPDSSMTKFMVDLWLPEGTRIETVAEAMSLAEEKLTADERVEGVATYIGSGPPRFYLPVEPELPYQSYGQLIVNVHEQPTIDALIADLAPWMQETFPDGLPVLMKYGVGPANTWKIEIRLSGPAEADPLILRRIANEMRAIIDAHPTSDYSKTDWRQRVSKLVPEYNQERARWASVTRADLAATTKRAFDGRTIGLYRQDDDLIPIVLRHVEEERRNVGAIDVLQIQPTLSTSNVPVAQVIDGVATTWEDPLIWRRDRRRTITVQANAAPGFLPSELRAGIVADIEAVELPPGYTIEWGGDFESSQDATESLIPGIVPALVIMSFLTVMLFNAFRPPLIILCIIPFAMIGITGGLLLFDVPFGFMALLGAMSLVGMMIKNAIVLLDQINIELAAGETPYEAVMKSAQSRLRPVILAAATTVLGVIPLLPDVFWVGLAVTIMAGLTVGSFLTMVLLPVLYTIFYRIPSPDRKEAASGPATGAPEPAE
ncbi:MAG: efflux RND transporter permease subunit [Alphaproteobacteria bacterium]|nr:efflux RND transporter permease subunit [Alphaproteobacteria bacterium]